MGVLFWNCSGMMGKEDGAVLEWVKSHLWYMHVNPLSRENPYCRVGFVFASERRISRLRSCAVGFEREKFLQQSSEPNGGNPIVE